MDLKGYWGMIEMHNIPVLAVMKVFSGGSTPIYLYWP